MSRHVVIQEHTHTPVPWAIKTVEPTTRESTKLTVTRSLTDITETVWAARWLQSGIVYSDTAALHNSACWLKIKYSYRPLPQYLQEQCLWLWSSVRSSCPDDTLFPSRARIPWGLRWHFLHFAPASMIKTKEIHWHHWTKEQITWRTFEIESTVGAIATAMILRI